MENSNLKKWIKSKDKKRIAHKHGVTLSYVNYVINNKRTNESILSDCIRAAEKNKEKSFKAMLKLGNEKWINFFIKNIESSEELKTLIIFI